MKQPPPPEIAKYLISRRALLVGAGVAVGAAALGVDAFDATPAHAAAGMRHPLDAPFEYRDVFGLRKHPVTGVIKLHEGQDYGKYHVNSWSGAPIRAITGGTVVLNEVWGGGGNVIRIRHADNHTSTYMHMLSRSPLSVGTTVAVGAVLGQIGNTGTWTTGAHLHLEVRTPAGAAIDPVSYINNSPGSPETPTTKEDNMEAIVKVPTGAIVHLRTGGKTDFGSVEQYNAFRMQVNTLRSLGATDLMPLPELATVPGITWETFTFLAQYIGAPTQ
ncbi:M23 family metallopeptidase [Microbacterium sp. K2]|uniref:M23 family metallopeptidase n=1 Tax=Microbacterium sp. K2 TaxID=3391827 RepID=UPI003ED9EB85